jgi:hypothetical protein
MIQVHDKEDMMPLDDLLDRLEDAEKRFTGTRFIAPLVGRNQVMVRIAGVVCKLRVSQDLPKEAAFSGWAILQALSTSRAAFIRPASLSEIARYLALFPQVRLVLVERQSAQDGEGWLACQAQQGDRRIDIPGVVPVRLVEASLTRFETVVARFDGHEFWYEKKDPRRDPAIAAYLQVRMLEKDEKGLPPKADALHKRGLSREERQAYSLIRSGLEAAARDIVEDRLADALAHSGAQLTSYFERGDTFVVRYQVDGREHVSTIHKDNLQVISAGICLAGEDQRFDLASLVGVLREGERGGRLEYMGEDW